MKRWLLAQLLLIASCASPFREPAPAELAALRVATGHSAWADLQAQDLGLLIRGDSHSMGVKSAFDLLVAGDGRYRLITHGVLGSLEVFDGTDVWRRDFSGIDRRLEWAERASAPRLVELLVGNWTEHVDGLTDDHRVRVSLGAAGLFGDAAVDLPPARPLELELDPLTSLPMRARVVGRAAADELVFADWRIANDLPLPGSIATYSANSGVLEGQFLLQKVQVVGLSAELFAFEAAPPDDVTFVPGIADTVELRRLPSGHLAVPVHVNGDVAKVFLVDTGAGATVIDARYAEQLHLPMIGEVNAVGVSGSAAAQFVSATDLRVGPMLWEAPVLVGLDFSGLAEALGAPVVGVLGFDWFARAEVEFDADVLRVRPTGSDALSGAGWHALELGFHDKVPMVRGTFPTASGAVTGRFRVDTGDSGAVTFHGPAVKRYRLLASRETTPISFGGVGGSSFGYVGELEWFELAGLRIAPLEAGFATQAKGTFASDTLLGNVGLGILGRYDVRVDYSRRQMALRERAE